MAQEQLKIANAFSGGRHLQRFYTACATIRA
jgi:hypothetical protein